jgi:hypothetical protein
MIRSDFKGYDPYDGSNSKVRLINGTKYTRLISTYVNKFSPINMRRLLKIPRSRQNQALAFIGRAMIYDYEIYRKEITDISNHLISESLIEKYGYHAWDAHGFPIQMRNSYHKPGITDVIGNEAVGRFFIELYKKHPDAKYKEICLSIRNSFVNQLLVRTGDTLFFKYTPETPESKWCYNASSVAAAYVTVVSRYFNVDEDVDFPGIEKTLCDVILRQKPGGEWLYSLNFETGYEKPQIDFHQGFILDSLLDYMECTGFEEPFLSAYNRGLDFYYNKQFLPDGRGLYRYPKKYPVNIHNQAQGIVTFSRAGAAGFGDHYFDFARTIAEWTVKNMQDSAGHFYYMKYPFFKNKTPYIRWNDASMAYAMGMYLDTVGENSRVR